MTVTIMHINNTTVLISTISVLTQRKKHTFSDSKLMHKEDLILSHLILPPSFPFQLFAVGVHS